MAAIALRGTLPVDSETKTFSCASRQIQLIAWRSTAGFQSQSIQNVAAQNGRLVEIELLHCLSEGVCAEVLVVMKIVRHKNIVCLHELFESSSCIWLILAAPPSTDRKCIPTSTQCRAPNESRRASSRASRSASSKMCLWSKSSNCSSSSTKAL